MREKLQNELIKKAINDAKQKAKLIADASNQQIIKIKTIKYGTFSIDDYGAYNDAGLNMDLKLSYGVPTSSLGFDIAELTFTDYVIIIYEIK